MKKTISMLLAVLMAAIAVCTFSVSAFAETTTANDDPEDFNTTVATTVAPTTAAPTTAAPTTAPATTAPTTTAPVTNQATTDASSVSTTKNPLEGILGALTTATLPDITATRAPGQTYIDDSDETTKAAPSTTKKPAKVESNIPSTGSTVVPVVALLALAAGTVAVVKTKKED